MTLFFPCLPKIRTRGVYEADRKSKQLICTKRTSKHPSLLPGVFTIYCEHGKLQNHNYQYSVIVSEISSSLFRYMLWFSGDESCRIPFTVIFERFPTGV